MYQHFKTSRDGVWRRLTGKLVALATLTWALCTIGCQAPSAVTARESETECTSSFWAGCIDPDRSTLSMESDGTTFVASGTQGVPAEVHLLDLNGRPVPHITVRLIASDTLTTLRFESDRTNSDGVLRFWILSPISQHVHIVAECLGVRLHHAIDIFFTPGAPQLGNLSSIVPQPNRVVADGVSETVVTARLVDVEGTPFPALPIVFLTVGGAQPDRFTATTDEHGQAFLRLTSSIAGQMQVHMSLGTNGSIPTDIIGSVSFVPGEATNLRFGAVPARWRVNERPPTPIVLEAVDRLGNRAEYNGAAHVFGLRGDIPFVLGGPSDVSLSNGLVLLADISVSSESVDTALMATAALPVMASSSFTVSKAVPRLSLRPSSSVAGLNEGIRLNYQKSEDITSVNRFPGNSPMESGATIVPFPTGETPPDKATIELRGSTAEGHSIYPFVESTLSFDAESIRHASMAASSGGTVFAYDAYREVAAREDARQVIGNGRGEYIGVAQFDSAWQIAWRYECRVISGTILETVVAGRSDGGAVLGVQLDGVVSCDGRDTVHSGLWILSIDQLGQFDWDASVSADLSQAVQLIATADRVWVMYHEAGTGVVVVAALRAGRSIGEISFTGNVFAGEMTGTSSDQVGCAIGFRGGLFVTSDQSIVWHNADSGVLIIGVGARAEVLFTDLLMAEDITSIAMASSVMTDAMAVGVVYRGQLRERPSNGNDVVLGSQSNGSQILAMARIVDSQLSGWITAPTSGSLSLTSFSVGDDDRLVAGLSFDGVVSLDEFHSVSSWDGITSNGCILAAYDNVGALSWFWRVDGDVRWERHMSGGNGALLLGARTIGAVVWDAHGHDEWAWAGEGELMSMLRLQPANYAIAHSARRGVLAGGVAIGGASRAVATGTTDGSIVVAGGYEDLHIVDGPHNEAMSRNGQFRWILARANNGATAMERIGGLYCSTYCEVRSVAELDTGSVVVAGVFSNDMTIESGSLSKTISAESLEAFVICIDASGAVLWSVHNAALFSREGPILAGMKGGRVGFAGISGTPGNIDSNLGVISLVRGGGYVGVVSSVGRVEWMSVVDSPFGSPSLASIAYDGHSDRLIVAGWSPAFMTLNGIPTDNKDEDGAILISYCDDGYVAWVRHIAGAVLDIVAISPLSLLGVVGRSRSSVDIAGRSESLWHLDRPGRCGPEESMFATAYDSSGEPRWAAADSGCGNRAVSATFTPRGSLAVAGVMRDNIHIMDVFVPKAESIPQVFVILTNAMGIHADAIPLACSDGCSVLQVGAGVNSVNLVGLSSGLTGEAGGGGQWVGSGVFQSVIGLYEL